MKISLSFIPERQASIQTKNMKKETPGGVNKMQGWIRVTVDKRSDLFFIQIVNKYINTFNAMFAKFQLMKNIHNRLRDNYNMHALLFITITRQLR